MRNFYLMLEKQEMASKYKPKTRDFELDPYEEYEEYEDYLDDNIGNLKEISKDFYSADWDDPSGNIRRISPRRKIERRQELKNLYSQLDESDDFEMDYEW